MHDLKLFLLMGPKWSGHYSKLANCIYIDNFKSLNIYGCGMFVCVSVHVIPTRVAATCALTFQFPIQESLTWQVAFVKHS